MKVDQETDIEEPRVLRVRNGWLAVTKPESTFRVGVVGSSEEEAIQRFREAHEALRKSREAGSKKG